MAVTTTLFAPVALAQSEPSATSCTTSLQSQVDAAAPGSVLQVGPCIYRETVIVNKPLTLVGAPGAEIRGSDVWSTWTRQSDSTWIGDSVPLPDLSRVRPCRAGSTCQPPYEVFLDGRPLQLTTGSPSSGKFSVDAQRRVVLADDVTGHIVEVATRPTWLMVQADNVTIDGLTMQHAMNSADLGALRAESVSNFVVRNSTLAYAHGSDVEVMDGTGDQITGNDIHDAGDLGVSGYLVDNLVVRGNRIHANNTAGYDPEWGAGGLKISTSTNLTIDDNDVFDNAAQGLWCDQACQGVVYRNNRVHDNTSFGIEYEISSQGSIVGNAIWNNGSADAYGWGANIVVSSSSKVDVSSNTVLATATNGILVISQDRQDAPAARQVTDVAVHDNVVVMNKQFQGKLPKIGLGWLQDWHGPLFLARGNNSGWNNAFWFSFAEPSFQRFAWGDAAAGQQTLADFTVTQGGQHSRYLNDAERDHALAGAVIPFSP